MEVSGSHRFAIDRELIEPLLARMDHNSQTSHFPGHLVRSRFVQTLFRADAAAVTAASASRQNTQSQLKCGNGWRRRRRLLFGGGGRSVRRLTCNLAVLTAHTREEEEEEEEEEGGNESVFIHSLARLEGNVQDWNRFHFFVTPNIAGSGGATTLEDPPRSILGRRPCLPAYEVRAQWRTTTSPAAASW